VLPYQVIWSPKTVARCRQLAGPKRFVVGDGHINKSFKEAQDKCLAEARLGL